MSIDKKSFVLGWLMCARLAGQRVAQKTLVGYSYNGVVLPALPEWDTEAYPYAVITGDTTHYALWVSNEPYLIATDADTLGVSGACDIKYADGVIYKDLTIGASSGIVADSAWCTPSGNFSPTEAKESIRYCPYGFIWANYDFLWADGTVCLKQSEPVPVYE